jgi:nucleotide-binding universal stress UspA family protein
MSTILVPADGSKNALRAVDHAVAAAKRTGGRVHLLNVQPIPDAYGMVAAYLPGDFRQVTPRLADWA